MSPKRYHAETQFERAMREGVKEWARQTAARRWQETREKLGGQVERDEGTAGKAENRIYGDYIRRRIEEITYPPGDDTFGGVIPQRSSVGSDGTPSSQRLPRG